MDAIVAVYSDWGIGAKGTQPVVVKADRARFRALTDGAAVIKALVQHVLTDKGLEQFTADWAKTGQKIGG